MWENAIDRYADVRKWKIFLVYFVQRFFVWDAAELRDYDIELYVRFWKQNKWIGKKAEFSTIKTIQLDNANVIVD